MNKETNVNESNAGQEAVSRGAMEGANALSKFSGPCRVKTWDEMDAVQRVELLRETCRDLQRIVDTQRKLLSQMRAHQHAADGEILVNLRIKDRDYDDRPPGYYYDPLK